MPTPGQNFRTAVSEERPLQLPGVVNAYAAILARDSGFRALYLSGAGVANASYGLPDLAITSLEDVLTDVRRITAAVDLPLLVDCDTGFGSAFNIARTVRDMTRAGAAAIHLEDQVQAKRCGHRPGKQLVSPAEMVDRIRAAADARTDPSFVLMARTDAAASEGVPAAIDRAARYVDAGADMIFAEALTTPDDYRAFTSAIKVPVLANLTEFGKTPLLTTDQLRDLNVAIALYPLSAFRAMSKAALAVYETLRRDGTQQSALPSMQTRQDLYKHLDYHAYEQKLDALFTKESTDDAGGPPQEKRLGPLRH
jgi:methylisocitrate lyase